VTAPDTDRGSSALLSFRAQNVRSFRDEAALTMVATSLAKTEDVWRVPWREGGQPIGVLPVAGVFGANASGKTNILRAMDDMRAHVLHSFRSGSPTGGITRRPFQLDPALRIAPSRYEIDIVLDGVRHEYGFSLDDTRVIEEWATWYPRGRPALLFHRHDLKVIHGAVERTKGRAVGELMRPNALFLSTAASANHRALLPLYAWFGRNLLLAEASSRPFRQALTTQLLDEPGQREQVLAFLAAADLGITGARKLELDPAVRERVQRAVRILAGNEGEPENSDNGPDFADFGVMLAHRGVDGDVEFNAADESLGTLVWFGLVGSVVEALATGTVLLADELDASLHPALVAQLVRIFQNPDTNPRHAQLIFNSHDATLLGDSVADQIIGRDQIWFTEKRDDGGTRLYALADLAPRKEEAIGRRYLAGRYGATPILSGQQFADTARLIATGDKR
jgi:uncharacterized protein